MFQGGECFSLGHLLRTWPPAISVKTTLRFSHRSETSVCTYSVTIGTNVPIRSRSSMPCKPWKNCISVVNVYLCYGSIEFLHVSAKHGSKLAEKFSMPTVILEIYFRLYLQNNVSLSNIIVDEEEVYCIVYINYFLLRKLFANKFPALIEKYYFKNERYKKLFEVKVKTLKVN